MKSKTTLFWFNIVTICYKQNQGSGLIVSSIRLTLVPVGFEDLFICEHGSRVKRVSETVIESIIHVFLLVGGFQSVSKTSVQCQ